MQYMEDTRSRAAQLGYVENHLRSPLTFAGNHFT